MAYRTTGKDPGHWYASRRRFIGAGLGAGFSAAFLAACGGSNNNSNKNTSTAATSGAASATSAPTIPPAAGSPAAGTTPSAAGSPSAAAAGGAVVSGNFKRGGRLQLLISYGDHANQEVFQDTAGSLDGGGSGICYSQLMRRKYGANINPGVQIIPEGDLAASWEQPDPTTFNFKLRGGVKWQNIAPVNGRALTADDVAYSINRQIQLKYDASYWPGVQSETAPDPSTAQIKIAKPDADFLVAACSYFNKVVAKEAVDVHGDLKDGPVIGSGAWIFKNWTPNQIESFDRNPDYYVMAPDGKPFPLADGLDFIHISDVSTWVAAFRTGKIDFAGIADKPTQDSLVQTNPKSVVKGWRTTGPLAGTTMIIRSDVAPTNDVRVRKALNLGVDRKGMTDTLGVLGVYYGGSIMAASDPAQQLPDSAFTQALPFDAQQAKQLIQAAGATGYKPTITVYFTQQNYGEFIQAQLKQNLGLDSTIETFDNTGLAKWFTDRDKQIVPFIRGTSIAGVNNDIISAYRSDGARNMSRTSDADLDTLLDQQATILTDVNKRNDLLHQIQMKVLADYGMVPLFDHESVEIYQPTLQNYLSVVTGGGVDPYVNLYLWLNK